MHKNYLPEIQQSQSLNHEFKVKPKVHSPNSSIEWEQLINTSIPNSVKAQLIPKNQNQLNFTKLAPTSDISYLRSTKRNFAKLGQSIYKEPELLQTKYDKNMQSFYSTLYRKSSARIPFNTNLERESFTGHLLDFAEIFQDNKKATGLQRYFGEILKLDLQQSVQEKEMIPPNRQQAIDLKDWLFMMIAYTKSESANMTTKELAERIQLIYASCLRELIKQVGIECAERGELLQTVWDFYVELIGQIIKCYSEQQKEQEKSYIEQMKRIQNFNESQMESASKQYKQLQEEIQRVKDEAQEAKDDQNLTKAKMLLLTADMKQLLQTNESQKNEIDSLLLQILLLKTSDNQKSEINEENEKINMKFAQGHSIVSHLLNYSKTNVEYKFKKKGKNINFEKFESLKAQEQMLKSDLISQQILEPDIELVDAEQQTEFDVDFKEVQTELDMVKIQEQLDLVEEQKKELHELQESNEKLVETQKIQLDQHINEQNEQQRELENRLKEAINLIQESELETKEIICESINLSIQQNQQLSQKLIILEKEETQQKVDLMEKDDQNQELESKLAQAVQDFISIIKKKKTQIRKLIQQKSTLQGTLQHIKTQYNIEINSDIIEEEKDASLIKSRDQSSEMQQESINIKAEIDEQEELDYQLTDRSRIKETEETESKAKKQLRMITKPNENNDSSFYMKDQDDGSIMSPNLQPNQDSNFDQEEEQQQPQLKLEISDDQKDYSLNTPRNQNSSRNTTLKIPERRNSSRNLQGQKKQNLSIQQNSTFKQRQQQNKQKQDSNQSNNNASIEDVSSNDQQKLQPQNEQLKQQQSAQKQQKQKSQQQSQQVQQQVQQVKQPKQQPQQQVQQQQQSSKVSVKQTSQQENPIQSSTQLSPTNAKNASSERQIQLNLKNPKKQTQKHSILEKQNLLPTFQEQDDFDSSGNQKAHKRYSQQPEMKSKPKQERGYISTQNELEMTQQSEDIDADSTPTMDFYQFNQGNNAQGERVKSIVMQYKDQKQKIRARFNPIVLEPKNQKRFKRIYSQNTDVANGLLNDVKSKKKPGKIQFSILQLQKLVTQILSDICKQTEGYKIPFHVSIYDYYKNKYGFKQVAEKKIRQVYQFIYFEKENNLKTRLLAQFCYMIGEMDEIGQKLLVESFQFITSKNDLNYSKLDLQLNYEAVSEFLTEKASVWLHQSQIQQLLQLYRSQQQPNQRYYINHDNFISKILEFYTNNKKDQQTTLESLFRAADLDGNNLIEFSEFKTLYRAIHQERLDKSQLIKIFTNNADFQDENGDKMLTLPRFTEMSIELGIFPKDLVLKYGEGSDQLKTNWEKEKTNIKYRFLRAKKFQKVRHSFVELDNLIKQKEQNKQVILWVSYKLLNEESQRVLLNYETKQCLISLMPELYILQQHNKTIEQLE